jgi:hypothetical protein
MVRVRLGVPCAVVNQRRNFKKNRNFPSIPIFPVFPNLPVPIFPVIQERFFASLRMTRFAQHARGFGGWRGIRMGN